MLRGRDIKRYSFEFADKWLICATKDIVNTDIPNRYSAICRHLERYKGKGKLGDNSTTKVFNRPWWSLMQEPTGYWDDFSREKMMYPNMTKFLPFYLDNKGYMQNDKSFMITGKTLAYLTAFLNSSLFKYCFIDNFPELQGGTREIRKIFLSKIPVLQVSEETNQKFKNLVNEIQLKKENAEFTRDCELKIDELIFDLYNLTELERKEIGFIEIL
ncbi:TaqI-like C-terminal specificity domain-containing protein [Chryseobacterium sp. JJR-5R]|uniref:TaqI-like C-terminal specificity domain-containing protein n=1 Tax=Chryseobacterium sp. JJR-5R TaxID=3093923 RepID=UPI002A75B9D9|nr:TaqI-like C-terminal specificity domain-containing protein [Chryseobacterium sp. JJR-5R]WPO84548.1 TaqI-like C-terminal specificity domain-containing protein [Chryseobacterium sp. JJR-5R]